MARLFLTPINLGQLELQNAAIQNLSTTSINAITPVVGQVIFDTTLNVLKMGVASTPTNKWSTVGSAGTGAGAPATAPTAAGQIYFDTTNLVLYVSKGTASAADWVPNDPRGVTADMVTPSLNSANSAGTSLKVAPIDHVHRHTNADHANITLNSLQAPTADVAMGGFKITGLADPTNPQDAATKYYVDAARTGLDAKASVRLASTVNLSGVTYNATGGTSTRGQITGAPNTLDGVNLAANDRILIKDQTAGAANGIWVVTTLGTGLNGVWDRATDFDTDAEVTGGSYVWVTEGNTQADSGWVLTNNDPIIIGGGSGTALTWVLFSSAGQLIAGNGLQKIGNQINVVGNTGRIVVNADDIDLATVSQTNTTGTAGISFVQSHTVDSYGRVTGTVTADVRSATATLQGIASFDAGDFSVTAGAVTIKTGGVDNTQLANSSITILQGTNISVSTSPVSLGGSTTIGITGQIAVANGGTGSGTAVGARANLGATGKYAANIGGAASIAVTHNLNSTDVVVMTYKANAQVECDVTITDANTVTIGFAVAPAANEIRVVVVG